jgi:hypothetical protein
VAIRNYLIEGVSGPGKTSVCKELQRRGYYAINGDTELAYQGDPETGKPTDGSTHEHHTWQVDRVKALVADQHEAVAFFCGGSRNFPRFIDLFDGVFVLEVDLDTLNRRLDERTENKRGGNKQNRNSLRDCIKQKKTFRRTASQSTPLHRSRTSLTRSFVKAKHIKRPQRRSLIEGIRLALIASPA